MRALLVLLVCFVGCMSHLHEEEHHEHLHVHEESEHAHPHVHEEEHHHEHDEHEHEHEHEHHHDHEHEHEHHEHHEHQDEKPTFSPSALPSAHSHSHDEEDGQQHSHHHGHSAHSDQPSVCMLPLDKVGVALARLLSGKWRYEVQLFDAPSEEGLAKKLELENLDGLITAHASLTGALERCTFVMSSEGKKPADIVLKPWHVWISVSKDTNSYSPERGAQSLSIAMPDPVEGYGEGSNRVFMPNVILSRDVLDLLGSLGTLVRVDHEKEL